MRIYLDDDMASSLLTRLFRDAGHDVELPGETGTVGADDPVHLTHAMREGRAILTGNYGDFTALHDLVMAAGGHHYGILVVRRDNDARRDLTPRGIVRAVGNLQSSGVSIKDGLHILNHWR
ncbi:MAG: DUF5615 family PIN-like protein [Planctomycetota bacterium]|nr:DUF5615 family PIN-like protein [Planctomycetota bacterium]